MNETQEREFDEKFGIDMKMRAGSLVSAEVVAEKLSQIKSHISKLLEEERGRVGEAIDTAWAEMMNRTFVHTLKDRLGPHEVTNEDWNNASFTIEEFRDLVLDIIRGKKE